MPRLTYKYRLYPTKAQVTKLTRTMDICRDVYNSMVNERTVLYELTGKSPSYYDQKKAIASWKHAHAELSEVHSQVLQNVCRRVDLAFQAFFRRVKLGEEPGYPRLKGKGQYDSITYAQVGGFRIPNEQFLRLSKIGDVPIKLHRPIEGDVKTCIIRRKNDKWWACFSCEVDFDYLDDSDLETGIDVGLKTFATFSDGSTISNPRFFREEEKGLAKAQRRFAKVKDLHRTLKRRAAKKAVARRHERIRNRRHNFAHQVSRQIVNRYGFIAVEELAVDNMLGTPAPRPDPANPGQFLPNGAAAKAGLNKSIADASWTMFRNLLSSKAENAGRQMVAVNPSFTSQMCSGIGCDNIVPKTLATRTHVCDKCGLVIDRDLNAAINILWLARYLCSEQGSVGRDNLTVLTAKKLAHL